MMRCYGVLDIYDYISIFIFFNDFCNIKINHLLIIGFGTPQATKIMFYDIIACVANGVAMET